MRNAAATFDEFDDAPAPRKSAPRKPRQSSAPGRKKKSKRSRFDGQRIARYAAIGMASTMAVGFMVNALMLQKGHHPAPLFGKAQSVAAVTAKPAAPLPPSRVVTLAEPSDSAPVRASAARDGGSRETSDAPRSTDAIGRLLADGPPQSAKADGKIESRTVIGVQKALTKLGFKVPATGTAGPATRKAIEAFEKDRHLPGKGDLSHRLVKVLAAESGMKID